LTHNGFEDIKLESRFKNGQGSKQLNRYGTSSSVHGDSMPSKNNSKGKQVFDQFDILKMQKITEIKQHSYGKNELQAKLEVAIASMDFEAAAAIRDILRE
jgi:protein-arginine kinase activator protein McsA